MLTQTKLQELFEFNTETGVFTRKDSCGKTGGLRQDGYLSIQVDDKQYTAHRLAWLYVYGEHPKKDIDHIDGNRCNNRITNLRLATKSQNGYNTKLSSNSTTGVKGVHWQAKIKRFVVQFRVGGVKKYFGTFKLLAEAEEVAKQARSNSHGEYARHV